MSKEIETPIPEIDQNKLLFGTIRFNEGTFALVDGQMPSLYFAGKHKSITRLRPLHKSGLGIFRNEKPKLLLFVGNPDTALSPQDNMDQNNIAAFLPLGEKQTIAADLSNLIEKSIRIDTADIVKNTVYPGKKGIFFVDEGDLSGTFFYLHNSENGEAVYMPVKLSEEFMGERKFHYGHTLILPDLVVHHYNTYLKGYLKQLLKIGQAKQFFPIPSSKHQKVKARIVWSEREYYPYSMVGSEQGTVLKNWIKSFVTEPPSDKPKKL
ncbi:MULTISPECIES: hypothetical protein [unclassified Pseudovibrio]|uniref:hypothetical protein n=1 Tax=unclassified Pseudovibrio TaxID=2627060 RepID=UPI0007B1B606|nr:MULTISPECIES: hypothetical protein [unclassified Pseudovibrio]KZK94107.1 hypothetical protein PsW74_04766 [Pseudovibrio sp. W74]KZL10037.1 hypothetical protein PsAD14_01562 [Pseudovibrio sp. Ad14]